MDKNLRLIILLCALFVIIISGFHDIKEIKNKEYEKENTFYKIRLAVSILALPLLAYLIYENV